MKFNHALWYIMRLAISDWRFIKVELTFFDHYQIYNFIKDTEWIGIYCVYLKLNKKGLTDMSLVLNGFKGKLCLSW